MRNAQDVREWLDAWFARNAPGAWPSERERRADLEQVVRRLLEAQRGEWRVVPQEQRTGNPGHPGGYQTVYVVVRHDDGGVYGPPSEARAHAVARALNALDEQRGSGAGEAVPSRTG